MLVIDIINHINTFAPLSLAEPWDNVGLMVGSSQVEGFKNRSGPGSRRTCFRRG